MDVYNTLHYLVGSVGPHLTTFVTFSHLTSDRLKRTPDIHLIQIHEEVTLRPLYSGISLTSEVL
jgi:hypothetical protein